MKIMAVCWLVLLWLAALMLGRQKPVGFGKGNGAVGLGMTRQEALKSPKLYLMMAVIMIVTACCGVQQQLPSLLSSSGLESGTVSLMISVMTAGLAVGKVAQGMLYGKLGVRRGGVLMMIAFAAGMLAMLLPALAWVGLILLAFGMGVYTTLLPLVARRIFGSREYASIWSLIATVGSVGTFLANPLWGTIYDVTGSYALGLVGCAVLLAAAIFAMLAAMKDT
jgi:predicted MFS family arabinose efflux permease